MPKTLITGGAGFLGKHVCERLLALGHDITVLDNLSLGKREHVPPSVRLEVIDLRTITDIDFTSFVKALAPDYIVHLAAIHYIPYCMAHPHDTFSTNVRSADLLINSIPGTPIKKIVSASTADVYACLDRIHSEDDEVAPQNPYGLSKLLSEEILAYGTRVHAQLSGVSLRFFNLYGPNDTNPHFIPRVIELLASPDFRELKMGYLGGARDFVHVSDAAEAVVMSLLKPTSKYDVFNVGTGIATSVRDVLIHLQRAFQDKRAIIEDKARFRTFDRSSLTPNVRKIQEAIGWRAQIKVKDGLRALADEVLAGTQDTRALAVSSSASN